MTPSEPLNSTPWEKFAQLIAKNTKPSVAYEEVYGKVERKKLWAGWNRLIHHPRMIERVRYLTKDNRNPMFEETVESTGSEEINLKSVIKTCRAIIDGDYKTPDKLSAINTLNKLGVFDNETKDDGKRMDPSALCEYLASFRGAPAKELSRIPGGLKGLMVRLMELTGASALQLIAVLGEDVHEPLEAQIPALCAPKPEDSKPSESKPLDFEEEPDEDEEDRNAVEDDETLVETIKASPTEPEEMSPEMRERLAPALEYAGAGKVEF